MSLFFAETCLSSLFTSLWIAQAPDAPPARPVRSAGRKRRGNPFAALGDDSEDETDQSVAVENNAMGRELGGGLSRPHALMFSAPGFTRVQEFSRGGAKSAGGGAWTVGSRAGDVTRHSLAEAIGSDDDPDL